MQSAISLEQVGKRFGSTVALRDLTLQVARGELLALLGPNGAGKTTAVSLMLGLRPPSTGRVRVFGADPREAGTRARLGAMLQESDLPATLKVRELIELFSRFYAAPLPLARTLDLAGLGGEANTLSANLSGGQRRRLVFALAVCGDPELLFLDEPTVAMDTESRAAFWHAISNFKVRGKTIVLTTHYLEEAERVADRVAVIDRGTLLTLGTPDQIRARVDTSTVHFTSVLVRAELRALPGVTRAEVDERGGATLHTRTPEALLAHLFSRGVIVRDLEVRRASLEEAFLTLTARPESSKPETAKGVSA